VARYTVELDQEDVECLPMIRMGMQQTENREWDLVCDILQQIEDQEFQHLIDRMNKQRGMTKE
tara:strand:+ start:1017 stop:1205 length:189 start_codon:yes stop_codon:yes gene_type:complete